MKQKIRKISSNEMRENWVQKMLHADQRLKQNHKEDNLPALAMAYFGHDLLWPRPGLLWPQLLTWPIWADFGRARPIWANGRLPPSPARTALRRTALRRTAQNFALFFPSPTPIFIQFFSLRGSSRGILVVFWSVGTSNVLVFALRLFCQTPAACRLPGRLHTFITPSLPLSPSAPPTLLSPSPLPFPRPTPIISLLTLENARETVAKVGRGQANWWWIRATWGNPRQQNPKTK